MFDKKCLCGYLFKKYYLELLGKVDYEFLIRFLKFILADPRFLINYTFPVSFRELIWQQ